MYYFPNVDPIYIYKRKGTGEDPYISVVDTNIVRNGAITLKEIPHFEERVQAFLGENELTEVEHSDLSQDEFRVDYTTGVAYFHSNLNSQEVRLEYLGTGYVSVPASRIWLSSGVEDPVESLEEVLDRVDEGVSIIDQMSDFAFRGDYFDSSEYKKWNFVFYKNKTYVALQTVSGEKPDESTKWRLVSSGVGFAGVYDENKTYEVGDIVADPSLKSLYFSKIDNNDSNLDDINSWDKMITLDDIADYAQDIIDGVDGVVGDIIDQESQREQNEQNRQQEFEELLLDVESLTDIIQGEEEARIVNEQERIAAEENRVSAEEDRIDAEEYRKNNETNRVNAEQARVAVFQQLEVDLQNDINDALTSLS